MQMFKCSSDEFICLFEAPFQSSDSRKAIPSQLAHFWWVNLGISNAKIEGSSPPHCLSRPSKEVAYLATLRERRRFDGAASSVARRSLTCLMSDVERSAMTW